MSKSRPSRSPADTNELTGDYRSRRKAHGNRSGLANLSDTELADAINQGHKQIQVEIHTALRHASAALMGALRTGAYLQVVHDRFGKSDWIPWLKRHCPALPVSTAYRYQDLARTFPHVRNPQEIKSLRQAYIKLGILHDAPAKEETKSPDLSSAPAFSADDLVARVKSMRSFYDTELERFDVTGLEEPVWHALKAEITALISTLTHFVKRMDPLSASKPAKAVVVKSTAPAATAGRNQ